MNLKTIFALNAFAAALAGCGSNGDVNIDASKASDDNSTVINNPDVSDPIVDANPCASYAVDGTTFKGSFDGADCVYLAKFADLDKPITSDITLAEIPGVHLFKGSLMIGKNYSSDADLAAAGITQGGDAATLTIEPGVTVAFESKDNYLVINRGAQIMAKGTALNPITITAKSDIEGNVAFDDVSQWGGMIINGFGITNKCDYGDYAIDDAAITTSNCHVEAEGKSGVGTTHYGGANNADSSGVLEYFIVKHTGAEVGAGNELNGISFDAVGSGTSVNYLQAYSTYDDGIEMFGGAVNINHYVALYVRDDSIDIDEGYQGTIDHALVIHSQDNGNRCVESDGIGSYSSKTEEFKQKLISQGLNSRATIKNLTCITSGVEQGTHDPSQGIRAREAHFLTLENALVTSAYAADSDPAEKDATHNFCFNLNNAEDQAAAQSGDLSVKGSIFVCQDLTSGKSLPNDTTVEAWLSADASNQLFQADTEDAGIDLNADNLAILDGFYSLPIADMKINGNVTTATPVNTDYIGAVTKTSDWTQDWTFGLHDGEPLWFN
ncbi:serine/threonine protein kinase [Marinagarivorans cellulosilyticus]|uniref:Serine/threonine protein kinase n=1 Tax=Marinagarivorans cellulosilyticus TaxID=2721545 RepID=A0AAN2BKY0_9GAMM|nr:serine/threonine protein kinase [Marinagarivorans cellulosilyticus]BCD98553.1 hypothetical protein MARGE09_P2754 [Marinagarivorans cellulosilyticus]